MAVAELLLEAAQRQMPGGNPVFYTRGIGKDAVPRATVAQLHACKHQFMVTHLSTKAELGKTIVIPHSDLLGTIIQERPQFQTWRMR